MPEQVPNVIAPQDENHRLYSIIERMQNKNSSSERDSAVAEADALSKNHDKDRDGNAALVKQLETQNVKLQEEISKLSDQAISLQNLSSRYGCLLVFLVLVGVGGGVGPQPLQDPCTFSGALEIDVGT